MTEGSTGDILVIDVGATSIKSGVVNSEGQLLHAVRKRKTPRPCAPSELVKILLQRIGRETPTRVVVGIPTECRDGVTLVGGNLSRARGDNTLIDTNCELTWRGYRLQEELAKKSEREVVVLNDAELAAVGCVAGVGKELVLALGTGFGVALTSDGVVQAIRDYGDESFEEGTYDSRLGEDARRADPATWRSSLYRAAKDLTQTYSAESVWLVGGNAKRLSPQDFEGVSAKFRIAGNGAPFLGATKIWKS